MFFEISFNRLEGSESSGRSHLNPGSTEAAARQVQTAAAHSYEVSI